jgi:hypothetical protein
MWTHTWMSFSSRTFTSLPLVHTLNPDFLRRHLWLCFLLAREFRCSQNLRAPWLPNLTFERFPNFPVFRSSWLRRFEIPDHRVFATPRLRGFKIPDHRVFATSRLRRFKIPDHRECFAPKKLISRTSLNSTFRGWRVFLNPPTLAPRGSGLTPTIRFHENLRISVKNVTPRTSEGTRVSRKSHNGWLEARSRNSPPSPL